MELNHLIVFIVKFLAIKLYFNLKVKLFFIFKFFKLINF